MFASNITESEFSDKRDSKTRKQWVSDTMRRAEQVHDYSDDGKYPGPEHWCDQREQLYWLRRAELFTPPKEIETEGK